ncbi:MAG: trypsin-like peptidase domain-containing protein [Candidatus Nitrosocosmicus sp.]
MVVFFNIRFTVLSLSLLVLLCTIVNPFGVHAQGETPSISGLFGSGNNSLLNDVFNKVKDSVVQISTEYGPSDSPNRFFDTADNSPIPTKFGSGFVYDTSGYIITNYHVVSEAKDITVTFNDGNTYSAQLVGTDPYGDVAVIKLVNPSEENLVPVVFSNSTKLKIGDPVLAIGNPYGLDNTLTFGIVSQMGRLLPNSDSGYSIPNVIQTDAAINPGNSGGPLIDLSGGVVGINTAIFSNTGAYTGVGFAIPSNDVLRTIPSLIERGSYEHPWLGIAGFKLTPDLAESFGLPRDYKGVVIENVVENGPADKAGLQDMVIQGDRYGQQQIIGKDILTKVDNVSITRIDDVISYLDINKKVGDKINLTVNRNGQILDLTATLISRPALSLQDLASPPPADPNVNPYSPFPDLRLPQLPELRLPQLPELRLPQLP